MNPQVADGAAVRPRQLVEDIGVEGEPASMSRIGALGIDPRSGWAATIAAASLRVSMPTSALGSSRQAGTWALAATATSDGKRTSSARPTRKAVGPVDRLPVRLELRVGDHGAVTSRLGAPRRWRARDRTIPSCRAPHRGEEAAKPGREPQWLARPEQAQPRRIRRTCPGTGSPPPRTPASERPRRPCARARPPPRGGRTWCRGRALPARPRPRSRRSPARPRRQRCSASARCWSRAAGTAPVRRRFRIGSSDFCSGRAAPCRTRGARCGTSRPWSSTSADGRTRRTRRPGGRSGRRPPGRRSPAAPAS